MQLIWANRALEHLDEVEAYIARDNPDGAVRWVERLISLAETLPSSPWRGRMLPHIERHDLREVFLGSYRLIYRVTDTQVQVLGVIEGHRRLPHDIATAEGDDPTS